MKRKTFLAGKVFQLTPRYRGELMSIDDIEKAQYIQFESILQSECPAFNLYDKAFRPLSWGEDDMCVLEATFADANPIDDFYKKKVQSNNKGEPKMGLSTFVKKLMDKDLRAMHELGYVDGDLTLTAKGTDWLLAELFLANKTELGKAAQAELVEKKKKKSTKCD